MPDRYVGELRVLQRLNQYEFAFEADILRTGPVQGGRWEFANLEKNYRSFAGRPVLIAYVGNRVGDGHNASEKTDPYTGERYRSFTEATAERIIGTISEDESDLTVYEQDGYKWLRVKGRIWSYYAKEAVETIVRTGRMDVSIEAEVHDMREQDGREVYDEWIGLGLTVLGRGVDPAVPGANIRALADMQEEFENMKLRVASLVKEETKPHHNTDNDKGVKQQMYLSKQQLKELQKKFGVGYAVLCAKQSAEGVRVLLMRRNDHVFCTYILGEKDSAIDEGRVAECAAQIVAKLAEDDELCADASECLEAEVCESNEKVSTLSAENERLTNELEASSNTVKAMQAAESKRRVGAAKEAAKRALSEFNAAREDEISEVMLNEVNADIDAGVYAACANADGEWDGEAVVAERVLALCAREQMKLDKASAQRKKGTYIMDKLNRGNVDDGTVQGLLARKGIN